MQLNVKKTVLENGLTILSERIPGVRSVSIGVWIKAGSRCETTENNGIAHFLEHMVFKGTKKRSAFKIAQSLEELGGNLNAYTSKELTVFYAHCLDTHLAVGINVLADLVCNPLFRDRDIVREKQVVFEEIGSVKDTPDEYIFDLFQEKLFPEQSLGYPILGTVDTVRNFDRQTLVSFWDRYYSPDNMVLSAAGNLDHDKFVRLARRHFSFYKKSYPVRFEPPRAAQKLDLNIREPVSQTHICAGLEGVSYLAEERFPLIAVNSYLGGGMSSRLFQVIREKHGLAYSVYSFIDFFKDTGIFSFYLGTDRKNQDRALDLLMDEVDKITRKPITPAALKKTREFLKGSLLLGLESSYRRMTRLAKNEIYYGRQISMDELIQQVDAITAGAMLDISRKLFRMDRINILRLNPNA